MSETGRLRFRYPFPLLYIIGSDCTILLRHRYTGYIQQTTASGDYLTLRSPVQQPGIHSAEAPPPLDRFKNPTSSFFFSKHPCRAFSRRSGRDTPHQRPNLACIDACLTRVHAWPHASTTLYNSTQTKFERARNTDRHTPISFVTQ